MPSPLAGDFLVT